MYLNLIWYLTLQLWYALDLTVRLCRTQEDPVDSDVQELSNVVATDSLVQYINENILGVIVRFSDTLSGAKGRKTVSDKIEALGGLQEIIKVAVPATVTALPQFITCLLSALQDSELHLAALQAWQCLVQSLPLQDLLGIFDEVTAILIATYASSSKDAKELIRWTFHNMLVKHNTKLPVALLNLTLRNVPELSDLCESIMKIPALPALTEQFAHIVRRCGHDNSYVCRQALTELADFLPRNHTLLLELSASTSPDPLIEKLVRCLLDVCSKYHELDRGIESLAVEALGMVGAIDPNRCQAERVTEEFVVLQTFEDVEEAKQYAMYLLERKFVSAFRSHSDTRAQSLLAYTMQELLKLSELTPKKILRASKTSSNAEIRTWAGFSPTAKETLTPFLTSKFVFRNALNSVVPTFPLYRRSMSYHHWLRLFTVASLNQIASPNAKRIFSICSHVVTAQDLDISSAILPVILLNVIVEGDDKYCDYIVKEMLCVLQGGNMLAESSANSLITNVDNFAAQTVFLILDYFNKWIRRRREI